MTSNSTFSTAAYGGHGWQPRDKSHAQELGEIWQSCGIENEWHTLKAVVLHTPGDELSAALENPDKVQMLEPLDIGKAKEEHFRLVESYQSENISVVFVEPGEEPGPNLMFCADLFVMTPEGAILARPASVVRAGEERQMAQCLARNGIPILKTLTGHATFEGADLIWVNRSTVLLGIGLRTNRMAVEIIIRQLNEMQVDVVAVDMPFGTMHLMGMLRIVDKNLALAWPRRTPHAAVETLQRAGYSVKFLPEIEEFSQQKAFNIVTLGPRKVLMTSGNPQARQFYESMAIECIETPASELSKAAGAVGCLTGILHRQN